MIRTRDGERDQLLDRLVTALTDIRASLGFRHNELSHLGIGQGGSMVLNYLDSHGPSKMSQTASALGVTSASITGITANLVRDGLIRRLAAPHDRRVVLVEVTDQGREKLKEVRQLRRQHAGTVLIGINDDDLDQLVALVERLSQTTTRGDRVETDNIAHVEGSF